MHIQSLSLLHYRNIIGHTLSFESKFNVLIGRNAQGKTNIAESIYMLSHGRSFRSKEFRDLIAWTNDHAQIDAHISHELGDDHLRMTLNQEKKIFFRNQKKARATPSKCCVILFSPEEIFLIRNSPSARRKYIDRLIGIVSTTYKSVLHKYETVVTQRNKLLQSADLSIQHIHQQLIPWNEQLAVLGAKVISARHYWLNQLNELIPKCYYAIAPNDELSTFQYKPNCGAMHLEKNESMLANILHEQLHMRQKDEYMRRITLIGPQRDDIDACIGTKSIKQFGSQGQHRTFILALKMAEISFLQHHLNHLPILILDDVASELDQTRNAFLFQYISDLNGQVFITTTNETDIHYLPTAHSQLFDICDGQIKSR